MTINIVIIIDDQDIVSLLRLVMTINTVIMIETSNPLLYETLPSAVCVFINNSAGE